MLRFFSTRENLDFYLIFNIPTPIIVEFRVKNNIMYTN